MRPIYLISLICLSMFILASVALAEQEFVFQYGKDGFDVLPAVNGEDS